MESRVLRLIRQHRLILPEDRVLVAYSGGPDSTALLMLLRKHWPDAAAVYVNHHLRAEESEMEEAFVRDFCRRRDIPLFVEKLHWKKRPSNLEEEARKRRYRHLTKVAVEQGFDRVALAHHRDDVVETFLLRLFRGSGPTGLASFARRRGMYVRPFLDCSRSDILMYLNELEIPFFTDSSNSDSSFRRNRVRNELIPYLRQHFNPAFPEAVLRTSHWIREQNLLLSELLSPYDSLLRNGPKGLEVTRNSFLQLPVALQKALLKRWIARKDPDLRPGTRQLEALLKALRLGRNLELPGFLMVESTAEAFVFSRKIGEVGYCEVDVPAEGAYWFPPGEVQLKFELQEDAHFKPSGTIAFVDADRASFPLSIRNWKRGDVFHPLGMKGTKKLSDYWIDRKVGRSERKRIPLVCKDEALVWVAGHQISDDCKITDRSRKVLRIELVKHA